MHTISLPARNARHLLSSIGAAALVFAAAAGCGGGKPELATTQAPYDGPPMAVDSTGPQHRIVMTAPSGGWTFTFDQALRRLDHSDVFVTVVRPDPAYMHTQALVTQEVGSTVDTKTPIRVHARVLEFGTKPADQPYRAAARAGK